MRITEKMLFNSATTSLRRSTEAVAKALDRNSAGRKILRPSDDPIASARILNYGQSIAKVDQFIRNISSAGEFLSSSDSVLSGLQERIARAGELATQMANAPSQSLERKIAAVEIRQIFEQVTAMANTTHRGQHIFAGHKTATKPFDFEKEWRGQTVGTSIEEAIEIVSYDSSDPSDASNDRLNLTVDGVNVQVTLNAGFYSGVALAEEIQGQVNEALVFSNTTPDSSVEVKFEPDEAGSEKGHLVVTSNLVKGHSSVVFNRIVQPEADPTAPAKPPLGDARLALGLTNGKSQLSGEEYLGDSGEISILAESGAMLSKNLPGGQVFKGNANGVDIFATLLNLETALETSNTVGIQTAITDMDKATDQISVERAVIGARLNRLDETKVRLTDFQVGTLEIKSKEEGSDLFSIYEAASLLVQQQEALQKSLAVQARILQQPTLLDFLR